MLQLLNSLLIYPTIVITLHYTSLSYGSQQSHKIGEIVVIQTIWNSGGSFTSAIDMSRVAYEDYIL